MDNQYVQYLRFKLQKRFRRLNSASYVNYHALMLRFWNFVHNQEFLSALIEELLAREPGATQIAQEICTNHGQILGDTDEEAAAIGYHVIKDCIDAGANQGKAIDIAHQYCNEKMHDAALPHFTDNFAEPLYEHLDEQLDDRGAVLALLRRYKHRVEWFRRERLAKIWEEDTQRGEKLLAMDIYEFLFDQGVDLYIEPTSASGEADMISSQEGEERLIADAKIFNPSKGKGRNYLAQGLKQIHTYAVDYNEPVGYLVIFNTSQDTLKFSVEGSSQSIPFLSINGKVIFLLTIDIHQHDTSASRRGLLKVHELTADYLVGILDAERDA